MAHLAAHGELRADNPLFSSLRLADGPLTVHDLDALASAPGVVVLGACDTAASVVGAGDELLGLAAALLRLGSRSLVAPLVPVPDEETRPLLELLHAELAAGRDCAEALAAVRVATAAAAPRTRPPRRPSGPRRLRTYHGPRSRLSWACRPRDHLLAPPATTCGCSLGLPWRSLRRLRSSPVRPTATQRRDELVERHARLVWSVLRSYRLDDATAADVFQTVWLRLVEQIDRIRDPERLAAWLATTARRRGPARAASRRARGADRGRARSRRALRGRAGRRPLADEEHAALLAAFAQLPESCQTSSACSRPTRRSTTAPSRTSSIAPSAASGPRA